MKHNLTFGSESAFSSKDNNQSFVTLDGRNFQFSENDFKENKGTSSISSNNEEQKEQEIEQDIIIEETQDSPLPSKEPAAEQEQNQPFYHQKSKEKINVTSVEYYDDEDYAFMDSVIDKSSEGEVIRLPEEQTSIENQPYYRKEPGRPRKAKIEKEALYGTETVAEMLGITSQTVRSYCDDFPEFITISRKEKGQRIFTRENIDQLRYVIEIKDKKNLTKQNLKAYLSDPEKYEMTDSEREFEALKQMIGSMMTQMEDHYKAMLTDFQQKTTLALEDKNNTTASILYEVLNTVKQQQDTISELTNTINKQQDNVYASEKEKLENDIQELQKKLRDEIEKKDAIFEQLKNELNKKDDIYEQLRRDYEKQSERIQELEKKKKGGLLGLFK